MSRKAYQEGDPSQWQVYRSRRWFQRQDDRLLEEEGEWLEVEGVVDRASPDQEAQRRVAFEELNALIARLPERQREILEMWSEDVPINDIARVFDASGENVMGTLARVMRALHAGVNQTGLDEADFMAPGYDVLE